MKPRTLLLAGLGLLVFGLLLLLGIDNPATNSSQQAVVVQGYLSNACAVTGSGLVVVAALVAALRRPEQTLPPTIDHYS